MEFESHRGTSKWVKRIYGVLHWTTPSSTFGLLLATFGPLLEYPSESRFDDCSLVFIT